MPSWKSLRMVNVQFVYFKYFCLSSNIELCEIVQPVDKWQISRCKSRVISRNQERFEMKKREKWQYFLIIWHLIFVVNADMCFGQKQTSLLFVDATTNEMPEKYHCIPFICSCCKLDCHIMFIWKVLCASRSYHRIHVNLLAFSMSFEIWK